MTSDVNFLTVVMTLNSEIPEVVVKIQSCKKPIISSQWRQHHEVFCKVVIWRTKSRTEKCIGLCVGKKKGGAMDW